MIRWVAFALVLPIVVPFASAQHLTKESAPVSCQSFAQQFYDWYSTLGQQESQQLSAASALEVSAGVALRDRPNSFSQTLRTALQKDLAAQSKSEQLEGIDFDPFFGSQDPPDHYIVQRPVVQNNLCSLQIWGYPRITPAERTGKPNAIAELKFQDGRWHFKNFRYPTTKASLLQILAKLRQELAKHS